MSLYISILDSKKEVSYDFYMKNYSIGNDGIEIEFSNNKSAFFLPSVSEDIKNENYIGAPISENHDSKKKKTGWWNK